MKHTKLLLFSCLCLFTLTACPLVPVLDSIKQAGMTESSRKTLLHKKVKKFHEYLMSGRYYSLGEFLAEERADALISGLRRNRKTEKIIEGKLDFVSFKEDAYVAQVDVLVQYYRTPYYTVNERLEKQLWKFSTTDGWRLYQRSVSDSK